MRGSLFSLKFRDKFVQKIRFFFQGGNKIHVYVEKLRRSVNEAPGPILDL